jgi:hypothetical protein
MRKRRHKCRAGKADRFCHKGPLEMMPEQEIPRVLSGSVRTCLTGTETVTVTAAAAAAAPLLPPPASFLSSSSSFSHIITTVIIIVKALPL